MAPKIRKLVVPDDDCGYDCEEDDIYERNLLHLAEREVWDYGRKSKDGIINGDYSLFENIEEAK